MQASLNAQPLPLLETETRSEEPVQKPKTQKNKMEKPSELPPAEESLVRDRALSIIMPY